MSSTTFATLTQRLDERLGRIETLDRYYAGEQPLSYLSPASRAALGDRLARVSVNLPRLVVDSLVERLRVTGFTQNGQPDPGLWVRWLRNDLDQLAATAHREALITGSAYLIVWADAAGRARITVESPRQMTALVDPATREVTAALKRWSDGKRTHAIVFEADTVTRYVAESVGATTSGFRTVQVIDNPLGVPPVALLRNGGRLLDEHGQSEMHDVLPLADAVVKLTTDMLVASEYGARPRRFATGIETDETPILDEAGEPLLDADGQPITEDVNPFPETDRMMIAEEPDARFGQLPGSDLGQYENALGVLMRQVSAVTGLPEHVLGIGSDNPTSADAIRASEAALTAKAEARQRLFGRTWEHVARLAVAVETGVEPATVAAGVTWADPATRSIAQEADAVVKLHAAGILPTTVALARLGYTAAEVDEIRAARRAEALDNVGTDLTAVL